MRWVNPYLILSIIILQPLWLHATVLKPEEVVLTSLKHYPKVLEAIFEVEKQKAQLQQASSAFDGSLQFKQNDHAEGYYDGAINEYKLRKPLPYLGLETSAGFRQSTGGFPSYEGKLETLNDGETFVAVSLSALRGALIDKERFNIWNEQENLNQSQFDLENKKIEVQTLALKAYWNWSVAQQQVNIRRQILDLANDRLRAIKIRVSSGDLPRIALTDNQLLIQKRKIELLQAEQLLLQAENLLALFYRDKNGQPLSVKEKIPLTQVQNQDNATLSINQLFAKAVLVNNSIKIIDSKLKQADLKKKLGTNELLPKLDVSYEWSQDRGEGPATLGQHEQRLMGTLEIPIEFNRGQALRRQGESEKQKLQQQLTLLKQQLKAEIEVMFNNQKTALAIFNLTIEQIEMADKLAKAEARRYNSGASDLVTVNLREQSLADSQITRLKFLKEYYYSSADLKKMILDFVK